MKTEEIAEGVAEQQVERRQGLRYAVDEAAAMLLVSHGSPHTCRILDLSLSGCRMCTDERLVLGESVRVELTFKVRGILFRFPGISRWTDGRRMFGIEFAAMSARRKEELAEIIDEIAADIIANAARVAAEEETAREQEAAEEAEQELRLQRETQRLLLEQEVRRERAQELEERERTEDEVRNKLVEKQNHRREVERESLLLAAHFRSAAATPLVPERIEPERPAAPPEKPEPRERRTAERHEVDTSAVIHLINIASRQTGRIIDLSMGGCRIRTEGRFPVGIYTRVETEFHLEGLPVRLGGVVQAIHNGKIVGIRFLDISLRKREQLEQLIFEIEESRKSH